MAAPLRVPLIVMEIIDQTFWHVPRVRTTPDVSCFGGGNKIPLEFCTGNPETEFKVKRKSFTRQNNLLSNVELENNELKNSKIKNPLSAY